MAMRCLGGTRGYSMLRTKSGWQGAYDILKRMKGGHKLFPHGFTIVETLIVLAVTGGLFVAIAVTLSGRQASTQFEQGIQDIRAEIQQTINDVSTGYYPSSSNFQCNAGAAGPTFSATAVEQGANSGCVFIGKVIQFDIAATNPEAYRVYSLAGLKLDSAGNTADTYDEANSAVIPNSIQSKLLKYGLTTANMTYGPSNTAIGAVGFVNSLSPASSDAIGSQQVRLLPIRGTALNRTQAQGTTAINTYIKANSGYTPDTDVDPQGGVTVCFASGSTNQSGEIKIGSNGRQLSVTLAIKGTTTC